MICCLNTALPLINLFIVKNPDYRKRNHSGFWKEANWLMKRISVEPATPQSLNAWNVHGSKNRLGFLQEMDGKQREIH